MKQTISISTETIIRTILIFLVLGFLFLIKNVLALFFVAIIMSAAFDPFIDYLQKKKFPRALSIIGVYIIFLSLIGGSFYLLAGPIVDQIRDMSRDFPQYYQNINQGLDSIGRIDLEDNNTVNNGLSFITNNLSKALKVCGSNISSFPKIHENSPLALSTTLNIFLPTPMLVLFIKYLIGK